MADDLLHGGRTHLESYGTSPLHLAGDVLRRAREHSNPLSATSEGSYGSFGSGSSRTTVSTAPSSAHLLTESPAALSKLEHLSLPLPASLLAAELGYPTKQAQSRRPSTLSSPSAHTSRKPLGRQPSLREPPRLHDPFAPLTLDPLRSDELSREFPLSLHPSHNSGTWMPNARAGLARGRSASVLQSDDNLLRASRASESRSRSPPVSRPVRNSAHHPSSSATRGANRGPPASSIPNDTDKTRFVEGLISVAVTAIEEVWKTPSDAVAFAEGLLADTINANGVAVDGDSTLDLKMFIKELLRRSRSTCSTLQVALYYIHKSRHVIRERVFHVQEAKRELQRLQGSSMSLSLGAGLGFDTLGDSLGFAGMSTRDRSALLARERDPIAKGRRMFVAALICASKFLQDRTYSNNAWAKICNLPVQEINNNEKAFLEIMDYNLFVNSEVFRNWTKKIQTLIDRQTPPPNPGRFASKAPYGSSRRPKLSLSIPRDGRQQSLPADSRCKS